MSPPFIVHGTLRLAPVHSQASLAVLQGPRRMLEGAMYHLGPYCEAAVLCMGSPR